MKTYGERGEGKLSFILWMVVLGLIAVAGWEAVPARVRIAKFEDFLISTAENAWRVPEAKLKERVLNKAAELELPITKDDVSVNVARGRIKILVEYTLPLELPFYTYEWHRTHDVDRPVYRF